MEAHNLAVIRHTLCSLTARLKADRTTSCTFSHCYQTSAAKKRRPFVRNGVYAIQGTRHSSSRLAPEDGEICPSVTLPRGKRNFSWLRNDCLQERIFNIPHSFSAFFLALKLRLITPSDWLTGANNGVVCSWVAAYMVIFVGLWAAY
jgi:hypothetical protein